MMTLRKLREPWFNTAYFRLVVLPIGRISDRESFSIQSVIPAAYSYVHVIYPGTLAIGIGGSDYGSR
jgi:hypothetical protein